MCHPLSRQSFRLQRCHPPMPAARTARCSQRCAERLPPFMSFTSRPPPPKSGARLCSFVFSTSCWCQPLPGLIDSLYSRVAASSPQVARAQGVGVEKSLRSMKEERCPLLKFLPHSRFVHIKMSALHERGRQRRTYTPVRRMRLCLL